MSVSTSRYSDLALDHAENPRNHGPLEKFNGHARITGPCGDTMEFWVLIQEGVLLAIGFTTDGCASSHACGSMATTLVQGRSLEDARALEQNQVLDALGDFPEASRHCALLACNTLPAACKDYLDLRRLALIQRKIVVLSGKGGVGKSTVAVNLACSLLAQGLKVGLLDVDVHGPSVPSLLGLEGAAPEMGESGLLPVDWHGLKVMSVGFLLGNPDDAVIWRGPRKNAVIRQFLRDVEWGPLDCLVVDSPPGTGDELLSVFQQAGQVDGAVVVTTPQKIAAVDARKSVSFCRELHVPVLGVIENMNGFACPKCGEITEILPVGAGRKIASEMKVPYLGSLPMDAAVARVADSGEVLVIREPRSASALRMQDIFNQLTQEIL